MWTHCETQICAKRAEDLSIKEHANDEDFGVPPKHMFKRPDKEENEVSASVQAAAGRRVQSSAIVCFWPTATGYF